MCSSQLWGPQGTFRSESVGPGRPSVHRRGDGRHLGALDRPPQPANVNLKLSPPALRQHGGALLSTQRQTNKGQHLPTAQRFCLQSRFQQNRVRGDCRPLRAPSTADSQASAAPSQLFPLLRGLESLDKGCYVWTMCSWNKQHLSPSFLTFLGFIVT